jgi:hypothetical protein
MPWASATPSGTVWATPARDITEILTGNPNVSFGPQGSWHWWGRPEGDYYAGSNRGILARHFGQISGAGIDFIVIDATNLVVSPSIELQEGGGLTGDDIRDMVATLPVCSPSQPISSSTRCWSSAQPATLRESFFSTTL